MHYVHEQHFTSFDAFNSAPHGWDVRFSTNSPGAYQAALKQSRMPGFLVNTAWLSSPTLQQGSTPEGTRTFALPLHLPNSYSWRGLPVDATTLIAFPSDRELFSMMGADSEILTISIDQRLFDRCLRDWEVDPDEFFRRPHTTKLSDEAYSVLHRNVGLLTEFMVKYGDCHNATELGRGIQELAIDNILQSAQTRLGETRVSEPSAAKRVKCASDYILARSNKSLTVGDVCEHVGCSRRTLEHSFQKYAGTSPKQFIKITRLESSRQALLSAEPEDRVTRIASQQGFWHMGQFSADYKALYGELPSETVKRKS